MPSDIRLLKTAQNNVLDSVRASGIAPTQFVWETVVIQEWAGGYQCRYTTSKFVHVPSGFYYQFGAYNDTFSPGHLQRVQYEKVVHWQSRLQVVIYWLNELKEQLDAPDLWVELLQVRQLSQTASDSRIELASAQFTPEEKEYVIRQLHEIKQHLIGQYQFQLEQTQAIDQGFQDIADAMNRFGKKDWINYAVGLLINIAVAAVFSPQAANDMLHSFMRAVRPLFDAAMKLIQ
jgi:hypothetical protein